MLHSLCTSCIATSNSLKKFHLQIRKKKIQVQHMPKKWSVLQIAKQRYCCNLGIGRRIKYQSISWYNSPSHGDLKIIVLWNLLEETTQIWTWSLDYSDSDRGKTFVIIRKWLKKLRQDKQLMDYLATIKI